MLAFFRRQNGRAFFPSLPIAALLPRSWRGAYSNGGAWDASLQLGYFCDAKCQRGFETTLAFVASRRACCPTAVFSIQLTRNPYQTGEPRGLSPSGGNSAANLLSLVCPAPIGRGMGSRGTAPCASRRACRRMAVFPIQLTRNPHQTREPWHPSCHGVKTPVKPHVTLRPCAHSAQRWVQGFSPANGCFDRSAGGSCGCRSAFR